MNFSAFTKLDELITTGNYEEAILQSMQLPPESFYLITYKHLEKLLKKKKDTSAFWIAMFAPEATHLFQSEFIQGRISLFWKSNWTLPQVEAFAKNHPRVFIQSIRISEQYLADGFLEMLKRSKFNNTYVDRHIQFMVKLRDNQKKNSAVFSC